MSRRAVLGRSVVGNFAVARVYQTSFGLDASLVGLGALNEFFLKNLQMGVVSSCSWLVVVGTINCLVLNPKMAKCPAPCPPLRLHERYFLSNIPRVLESPQTSLNICKHLTQRIVPILCSSGHGERPNVKSLLLEIRGCVDRPGPRGPQQRPPPTTSPTPITSEGGQLQSISYVQPIL